MMSDKVKVNAFERNKSEIITALTTHSANQFEHKEPNQFFFHKKKTMTMSGRYDWPLQPTHNKPIQNQINPLLPSQVRTMTMSGRYDSRASSESTPIISASTFWRIFSSW